MRPATCAKPLSEARNTAVAAEPGRLQDRNEVHRQRPKNHCAGATMSPNSTMPMARGAPFERGMPPACSGVGATCACPSAFAACQPEPMQRQANEKIDGGKDEQRGAPADAR